METRQIAPGYAVSRVIRGGWQLAGGHGAVDRERAVDDLLAAFDAGITTFDGADIYTGVEDLYGAFRQRLREARGAEALGRLRIHTKLVPDLSALARITKADVEGMVARSASRLGVERLDLVQLHWWDLAEPRWMDVAVWLAALQAEGRIALVGGTNFDADRTGAMLAAGVPLSTMQVQYSVLDERPAGALARLAVERGVALLCYGSVAGGFLGERWLGAREPAEPLENRSLTKYKLIIDDFGGWPLFQALLAVLARIGAAHGVGIAAVAGRWVLDRPGVAAVIVGARNRAHLDANAGLTDVALTDGDRAAVAAVLAERRGPTGPVYALERDRTGPHGRIMKYELNAAASKAPLTMEGDRNP